MDGFSSAALMMNYINAQRKFGDWQGYTGEVVAMLHEDKTHGLDDSEIMRRLRDEVKPDLFIIPDASGSKEQYDVVVSWGIDIIVLDHHDMVERGDGENVIVVNNQQSEKYTNKHLSGVGIVWQFCRVLDDLLTFICADNWLDLVALGNVADVMDLRSHETRFLVMEGLKETAINSYFLKYCQFAMHNMQGKTYNPHNIAFYIAPLFNAVSRIGDQETKQYIFDALLDDKAATKVKDGTKGHKGEVDLVQEAIRLATNTKSRQDRRRNKLVEMIDKVIQEENLIQHKVLVLAFDDFQEEYRALSGLAANLIADMYQRPAIITFKKPNGSYVGSLRVNGNNPAYHNFKDQCMASGCCTFAAGHQEAAGIGIKGHMVADLIDYFDEKYSEIDPDVYYDVDFMISAEDPELPDLIAELSSVGNPWGQGLEAPKIAVTDVKVGPGTLSLFGQRQTTLCIQNKNIKFLNFKSGKTEFDALCPPQDTFGVTQYYKATIVGKDPEMNEFRDAVTPQLMIEDYNIEGFAYDF